MFGDSPQARDFLQELYECTSGDLSAQASMYDVGAALGMERDEAGRTAEDLIGNGLVEVKTLSGGIGITPQGLEAVQTGHGRPDAAGRLLLNSDPVLDDPGRKALVKILEEIKNAVARQPGDYGAIEELVIDIKTIETQLLSPSPKTAILREVLRSLAKTLSSGDTAQLSDRVQQMADA